MGCYEWRLSYKRGGLVRAAGLSGGGTGTTVRAGIVS